jgi:Fic family protein
LQIPPYTISLKAADYLAKIVETVTRLEMRTDFRRDIRLHRENRVRSIYSSLAIEGNTLSLDEVTDVINGKLVAGRQVEIKEVKNAFAAYDKIMAFDPYKVKDFLKAHKLMTDGLVAEAGNFRRGDVAVFDDDVLIHAGARPQFVPELIAGLFGWAKETELHPVIKSAVVHSEIETIHPFADGNGRTGRLWQTLILAKWNPLFEWIPMESLVYENRSDYYDALQNAQKANDSTGFIEFSLSAILEAVEAQAQLQAKQEEDGTGFVERDVEFAEKFVYNDTQKTIIKLMMEQPRISAKTIAEKIGMSARGVQKSIDGLKKLGLVERIGAAKGGHWIIKSPED